MDLPSSSFVTEMLLFYEKHTQSSAAPDSPEWDGISFAQLEAGGVYCWTEIAAAAGPAARFDTGDRRRFPLKAHFVLASVSGLSPGSSLRSWLKPNV